MADCCDYSGGRVRLTINGIVYSARSALTVRPTNIEREAGANQDGTLFVTTKPVPAEAEINLGDKCGLNISDLTNQCHIDGTLELIDMKKQWLFTRSTVVGRPEYNTETGEITGLKLVSASAQEIFL